MAISRYARRVPLRYRLLRRAQRLARPNWWIGAAERPAVTLDENLARQIDEAKKRVREHVAASREARAHDVASSG
jgi:hypothetical protein